MPISSNDSTGFMMPFAAMTVRKNRRRRIVATLQGQGW